MQINKSAIKMDFFFFKFLTWDCLLWPVLKVFPFGRDKDENVHVIATDLEITVFNTSSLLWLHK